MSAKHGWNLQTVVYALVGAVGLESASTVVYALHASRSVGLKSASTVVKCKECGGSQICEHGRRRFGCNECRAAKAKQSQ